MHRRWFQKKWRRDNQNRNQSWLTRMANIDREGDVDTNQTLTARKTDNTRKTWLEAPDMDDRIDTIETGRGNHTSWTAQARREGNGRAKRTHTDSSDTAEKKLERQPDSGRKGKTNRTVVGATEAARETDR